MKNNPLEQIDAYKAGHRQQYPENTTLVYSNLTARANKRANIPDANDFTVFFGLQYFVKHFLIECWNEGFFNQPKAEIVAKYKRRMDTFLGPDAIPVDHIEALHDLGYLPLEIRALEEGTKAPIGTPMLTIHNTKDEFFWLVNYLESVLSAYMWKPITTATVANWYKTKLDQYAKETASQAVIDNAFTMFQGHDFSFRGMAGPQDAAMSGAAHLLSFLGTDTIPAISLLEDYYGADATKEMIGCSVPATEHSVMCMGEKEAEIDTFRRLITQIYPNHIVSVVSDTWDFFKVLTDYLPQLKSEILARSGGPVGDKVVIRPDSGDPVMIVCGQVYDTFDSKEAAVSFYEFNTPYINGPRIDKVFKIKDGCFYKLVGSWEQGKNGSPDHFDHTVTEYQRTPEEKGAVELLWETFGGEVNEKGFKQLDPHIGLIYGDSITPQRMIAILDGLKAKGFASTNIVFGIGSFTYQYCTRDTFGMAVKATYGEVGGVGRDIFKDPATDTGKTKKSMCGLLQVYQNVDTGGVETAQQVSWEDTKLGLLQPVFIDGKLLRDQKLADIRAKLAGK